MVVMAEVVALCEQVCMECFSVLAPCYVEVVGILLVVKWSWCDGRVFGSFADEGPVLNRGAVWN